MYTAYERLDRSSIRPMPSRLIQHSLPHHLGLAEVFSSTMQLHSGSCCKAAISRRAWDTTHTWEWSEVRMINRASAGSRSVQAGFGLVEHHQRRRAA
jgi:hypothetical protein